LSNGGRIEIIATLGPEVIAAIADEVERRVLAQLGAGSTEPYLTVAQAADYIGAKPQRIYDLCSNGTLTRLKDGSRLLILRAEVDAYLQNGPA
jgi:excisionase family DNA binding protein